MRRNRETPHFLLLRAYSHWDFPKGMVETHEDPLAAAIREVAEETTLTDLTFIWGQDFIETPPYGLGKIARYYVAESAAGAVDLPYSAEIGKPEHDEFRWVDFDAALTLLSPRVRTVLQWAQQIISAK